MIPLVGYLIYVNNKNFKTLVLWLIPVILIPSIWPAYSIVAGQFDEWFYGIILQTERHGIPLSQSFILVLKIDPISLLIGAFGIIFALLRKDVFIFLWIAPYLCFLYFLGWAPIYNLILLFPPVSIAAGRLICELSNKIPIKRLRIIILTSVTSCLAVIGGIVCISLITTNITDSQFNAIKAVAMYMLDNNDNNASTNVTLIGSPVYSWMFKYIPTDNEVFSSYRDLIWLPIKSEKVILIS